MRPIEDVNPAVLKRHVLKYPEQYNFTQVESIVRFSAIELLTLHMYVDWDVVSTLYTLSEVEIVMLADYINWRLISLHQVITEPFIRQYAERLNIEGLMNNMFIPFQIKRKMGLDVMYDMLDHE